jgi:hypothetical protein
MNPDDADEKDRNYRSADRRFERLPQGAEQANGQENLRTALDVARRVHRANPSLSPAIYPDHREIWRLNEETKELESQAIYEWADANRLSLDAAEFTRLWFESGCIEGGENQVFSASGVAYKRNNLAFHTSYLEYFERLILHNWLFPDTYYTFLGFMWVTENEEPRQWRPVVSQKAFRAVRGATRQETEVEMNRLGFTRRYEDNYVNTDLNLFVDDLHDQNVLIDATGELLIFDPVIYLADTSE